MTSRRAVLAALIGVVLAVGVAQAGWFFQSGRWYYTPDVGAEVTLQGIPNPASHPSKVVWTLTTERYDCACYNNGGNFASEVVSVEQFVTLSAVTPIDESQITSKKKGIATVPGTISTDELCKPFSDLNPTGVVCQNPNWTVDPTKALIQSFDATSEAYLQDKDGNWVLQNTQAYDNCKLPLGFSSLNLPPPNTNYVCD